MIYLLDAEFDRLIERLDEQLEQQCPQTPEDLLEALTEWLGDKDTAEQFAGRYLIPFRSRRRGPSGPVRR